jgi:hypothetical protein
VGEGQSENPLARAFWLGSVDPRPFAIFRIGLGVTVLHDLADYALDLRAFLADDGMLPRGVVHDPFTWSVFDLVGGMPGVAIVFALGVLSVLAFTVGFQTRVATVLSWLFLISLHHRNYYVTDGGDDLVRILFFWSMFCDLGSAYGVDARRRGARAMHAFVPRLLQAHIAVLYLVAALLKLRIGWLHGDAIFLTLQLDGFVRPFGAWLGTHPALCKLATRSIVLMELGFPFFAFAPWRRKETRAIAIMLGAGVQLGVLFAMRVGIFTETMLWILAMWLQPEWIDRFAPARIEDAPPAPRAMNALYAALGLQFVLAVWDPFLARRLPLPRFIKTERTAISIVQPFGLFDTTYAVPRWDAPGKLGDGTDLEVLSVVAPGARPREPAMRFSRWNKFTFKEIEHPIAYAELGAYFCRAHDERTGKKLASFTLVNDATPPHDTSGRAAPAMHTVLWEQRCTP